MWCDFTTCLEQLVHAVELAVLAHVLVLGFEFRDYFLKVFLGIKTIVLGELLTHCDDVGLQHC